MMSTFFLQGIAFFTTPVFTAMLGTSQFGIYAVFNAWVCMFTCIMGLGVTSTLPIGKYVFHNSYFDFRSSILLLSTLIGCVIIFLGLVFSEIISSLIKINEDLIIVLLITSFSYNIVSYAQSVFIYEKKALSNLVLSVGLSILTVFLSICLIRVASKDFLYVGRIYGVALPYFIIAVVLWIKIFFKNPSGLKKEFVKFGICVGFPIVFHMLSHNVLIQSDRVMMQWLFISSNEIGMYSFFYTLSSILSVVLTTLNTSWCPFYFDYISKCDWNGLNIKAQNYIETFTAITTVFLLVGREVSKFMAPEDFQEGIDVLPILIIAVYCTFLYQFPTNYEFYYKRTTIIAIGTLIAGFLNIILNYLLIPVYGMYGAAVATVFSYMALFVIHYVVVMIITSYRFCLSFSKFIISTFAIFVSVILFFILKEMLLIRWILGLSIGILEIIRMVQRKGIF